MRTPKQIDSMRDDLITISRRKLEYQVEWTAFTIGQILSDEKKLPHVDSIIVRDRMTNGAMIMASFDIREEYTSDDGLSHVVLIGQNAMRVEFDELWWNAPYQMPEVNNG